MGGLDDRVADATAQVAASTWHLSTDARTPTSRRAVGACWEQPAWPDWWDGVELVLVMAGFPSSTAPRPYTSAARVRLLDG